jgi:hypothetical protein
MWLTNVGFGLYQQLGTRYATRGEMSLCLGNWEECLKEGRKDKASGVCRLASVTNNTPQYCECLAQQEFESET